MSASTLYSVLSTVLENPPKSQEEARSYYDNFDLTAEELDVVDLTMIYVSEETKDKSEVFEKIIIKLLEIFSNRSIYLIERMMEFEQFYWPRTVQLEEVLKRRSPFVWARMFESLIVPYQDLDIKDRVKDFMKMDLTRTSLQVQQSHFQDVKSSQLFLIVKSPMIEVHLELNPLLPLSVFKKTYPYLDGNSLTTNRLWTDLKRRDPVLDEIFWRHGGKVEKEAFLLTRMGDEFKEFEFLSQYLPTYVNTQSFLEENKAPCNYVSHWSVIKKFINPQTIDVLWMITKKSEFLFQCLLRSSLVLNKGVKTKILLEYLAKCEGFESPQTGELLELYMKKFERDENLVKNSIDTYLFFNPLSSSQNWIHRTLTCLDLMGSEDIHDNYLIYRNALRKRAILSKNKNIKLKGIFKSNQ